MEKPRWKPLAHKTIGNFPLEISKLEHSKSKQNVNINNTGNVKAARAFGDQWTGKGFTVSRFASIGRIFIEEESY